MVCIGLYWESNLLNTHTRTHTVVLTDEHNVPAKYCMEGKKCLSCLNINRHGLPLLYEYCSDRVDTEMRDMLEFL